MLDGIILVLRRQLLLRRFQFGFQSAPTRSYRRSLLLGTFAAFGLRTQRFRQRLNLRLHGGLRRVQFLGPRCELGLFASVILLLRSQLLLRRFQLALQFRLCLVALRQLGFQRSPLLGELGSLRLGAFAAFVIHGQRFRQMLLGFFATFGLGGQSFRQGLNLQLHGSLGLLQFLAPSFQLAPFGSETLHLFLRFFQPALQLRLQLVALRQFGFQRTPTRCHCDSLLLGFVATFFLRSQNSL